MKFFTLLFLSISFSLVGQLQHPKASPFAQVVQNIGLSTISVSYSRPAAKQRFIFGTDANGLPGLVPYGRIWRVGANEATKITISTAMSILGNTLPKGTYALYAFPNEEVWEIVFHGNLQHWGDGRDKYNPDEDVLRVKVTPETVLAFQENFSISFDELTHNSATMLWHWANTVVKIPITVDTKAVMESNIQEKLKDNPTAQTYYEIARYYQEQGINLALALDYVNTALEVGGDTYYFYRVKSLIQADLRNYKAAIQAANKSMSLANALGKDEFVRMNRKAILQWQLLTDTTKRN